jgi:hypothetical protein
VVGVAWYDRRDDPTRRCWKQYFTASLDGGATFLPNTPVSTAASCPGPGAAPALYVWNGTADFDDTTPRDKEVEKLRYAERLMLEERVAQSTAWEEAHKDATATSLRVSFDPGRSAWPGHYTGLDADSRGVFHAFWSDRRNKLQQIFTAPIEVVSQVDPTPPTKEQVLGGLVQLVAGPGQYDEAKGTSTFELQVRNVSDRTVYGPIKVRVTKLLPEGLQRVKAKGAPDAAPVAVVDADAGGPGVGATWDFSKALGDRNRLDPKMISEVKKITIRSTPAAGLDATLEFQVLGQVALGLATGPVELRR